MLIWNLNILSAFYLVMDIELTHRVVGDTSVQALSASSTISCNDSQTVINITSVTFTRLPAQCSDTTGYTTISTDTIALIKTLCDNKKFCKVDRKMISDKEPFLNDLLFYNLSYTCESEVQTPTVEECNFDKSWCSFTHKSNDSFKWRRRKGSSSNVPSTDHTCQESNSKGRFAYILQKNSSQKYAVAAISTELVTDKMENCLTFWIFKTDTKHNLKVYDVPERIETLTQTFSSWTKICVQLSKENQHNIKFEVDRQNEEFDGTIALDDFKVIGVPCVDLKTKETKEEICVPLNSKMVVMNCSNPKDTKIKFDSVINECSRWYDTVHEATEDQCDRTHGTKSYMLDVSDVIHSKPDCFWRNAVHFQFTCLNDTEPFSQRDIPSTTATKGIAIGSALVGICILVALIALIIKRLSKNSKNTPGIKEQNKCSEHVHSQSNTNVEESNYTYIESGHRLIQDNRNDNISASYKPNSMDHQNKLTIKSNASQSVGQNFESTEEFSMSKSEVDNESTYFISDTEYAVSGRNYHEGGDTSVYDHSVDNLYNSSVHARKDHCDGNSCDHFIEQKTEDDYDISR